MAVTIAAMMKSRTRFTAINQIADQTNLLALNRRSEARAGHQGRGFASWRRKCDELCVHAEDEPQGALHLLGRVVADAQRATDSEIIVSAATRPSTSHGAAPARRPRVSPSPARQTPSRRIATARPSPPTELQLRESHPRRERRTSGLHVLAMSRRRAHAQRVAVLG